MPVSINGNTGVITGISAGGLPDGCITADDLASGAGGKILQVQQSVKSDTASFSGSAGAKTTDISGLTVNITPSSSSNKILVQTDLHVGGQYRYWDYIFLRDSTEIGIGADDGNMGNRTRVTGCFDTNDNESFNNLLVRHSSMSFLDTPNTTSQITYKISFVQTHNSATQSLYINRTESDGNNTYAHRCISQITATEVSA